MNSRATYDFIGLEGAVLVVEAEDAIAAYREIKRKEHDNWMRFKRYELGEAIPSGYSALDIGYGLVVAYKRIPHER